MGRYSTRALRRERSHVRIVSGAPLYARARYRRPPGLLSRQPCFAKPRQGGPVGLVGGTEYQYSWVRGSQWTSNGTALRNKPIERNTVSTFERLRKGSWTRM